MVWQRCPVCEGRMTVPAGFYGETSSSNASPEKCRSCHGSGMVMEPFDCGPIGLEIHTRAYPDYGDDIKTYMTWKAGSV